MAFFADIPDDKKADTNQKIFAVASSKEINRTCNANNITKLFFCFNSISFKV